jgi:hypothetical protein
MSEKVIATIEQGEMAELRVRLDIWEGRLRIDLRIYNGPKHERRPTIRGFCVRPGQLNQVITALLAAKREAVAPGWLDDESDAK